MNSNRAFFVGALGALMMSNLLLIARDLGVAANLALLLGTMFGESPSSAAWALGIVMHALFGGLIAQIYALLFEKVLGRATASVGLILGFIHGVVSGALLAVVPAIHPAMPEQLPAPGPYMANLGLAGIAVFLGIHMVYGAIVGGFYGPPESERLIDGGYSHRVNHRT